MPLPREEQMWIGGEWVAARSGRRFPVTNPATGAEIGTVPDAGPEDAARAIDAAQAAFRSWSGLPARARSDVLYEWYAGIRRNEDALATLLTTEQGKSLREARTEIQHAADFARWYAEEACRAYGEVIPASAADQRLLVLRQPVGVVAAITPWNFPASMITRKVAPALAAGCTVVLKPAEQTPLIAAALCRLLGEAKLPAGVVNLVTTSDPEPIGKAFMADRRVRKISFTGSTEVGKRLYAQAADQVKRLSLELGGNAPVLIFPDADLERAVRLTAGLKFLNAGQACASVNRIFVHESVAQPFTDALVARVAKFRVGNGLEEGVRIGPLIDEQALAKVSEHVADATSRGARAVLGGRRLTEGPYAAGLFFAPTVLVAVRDDMRVAREEIFGPVAPVLTYADEDEALERVNDTPYGLASYVFTRDVSRVFRVAERLDHGMVAVNDVSLGALPQAPFGGIKESGLGREGGRQGLDEFLEHKQLVLTL